MTFQELYNKVGELGSLQCEVLVADGENEYEISEVMNADDGNTVYLLIDSEM